MSNMSKWRISALVALPAVALVLSACSPGSLGSSGADSSDDIIITYLGDNSEQGVPTAKGLTEAFNAANPGITVKVDTRAQGADGDNIVKTRLATGEMAEVFAYNSGSLMQVLNPAQNLVPLTDEPFVDNLEDAFKTAVTSDGQVYGAPINQAMGGGILYNKQVFADLGLEIPRTWDEFMANNAIIKEAGIDPVIQTYGDTWSAQLLVLGDFHNVSAAQPDWAEQFSTNNAHFTEEPAIKGFERLEELQKAGYLNKDFASAKQAQGLQKLVDGTGAQYPMLTFVTPAYVGLSDNAAENIGFFAQPGDDADSNGLTAWMPTALYIPNTATGEKLEAAKKFVAFVASQEGCEAQNAAATPTGPYMVKGCTLPDGLPSVITDLQSYFDDGHNSLALEFLSPIKGPNLDKIAVEVGSGMNTAAEGAARYDEDVRKQAQQLGLAGW